MSLPKLSICITVIFSLFVVSFQKRGMNTDLTMQIRFRVYVHGEPLQLNTKYKNPFGEDFEISRFRFYAGKIEPRYTDPGLKKPPPSIYHLIDLSDSASTFFELPVTRGSFDQIQISLGIDSADQCRGAQNGALDPLRGMFWTWNSGYQSFKIEGTSPESDQPARLIAYHIGGYRYPYSTVWKFRLNTDSIIRISEENKLTIEIPLELDYFFNGPHAFHIKEIPTCTVPGEMARKLSENFIGSFTGLRIISKP
jgi:hypothetical protein